MVAARLVVTCTDKVLYARALAAFWHVHSALEAEVAKNAGHKGAHHTPCGLLQSTHPTSAAQDKELRAPFLLMQNWERIARLTRLLHRATAFEADLQYLLGSAHHQPHMALAAEAPFCHTAEPTRDKLLSLAQSTMRLSGVVRMQG